MAKALADVVEILAEVVEQAGNGADFKTVDRAVAHHAPRFFPIADNPHFVGAAGGPGEEGVDIVDNHNVDVQKQGGAA